MMKQDESADVFSGFVYTETWDHLLNFIKSNISCKYRISCFLFCTNDINQLGDNISARVIIHTLQWIK